MYRLFRELPLNKLGAIRDVNLPYIRRIYAGLIKDVQTYYRKRPKHIASNNLFAEIIKQFVVEFRSDDFTYANKVEKQMDRLISAMGLTSPVHRGKIFQGITLGQKAHEVVIASYDEFPTQGLGRTWRELKPLRYLYHTRTDVQLAIQNNSTPGKAYGVVMVNIPMLLVQYRYWLRWQQGLGEPETVESPMRFVGAFVLPNAIESYLEISWFNRLARNAKGIPNAKYLSPHPFYVTDMSDRLEKLATFTNNIAITKAVGLQAAAAAVPGITNETLFETVQLPRSVVTLQNEWAIAMARLPYIQYLTWLLKKDGRYDRSELNSVVIDLMETVYDSTFRQFGNNEFVKQFQDQALTFVKENKN